MRVGSMVVAGALVAGVAHGAELRTSGNVATYWDDDANNAGDDERDGDLRLDTGASFDLASDPGARATWRLGYTPTYEQFLDLTELDNWRHRMYANVGYALGRATTLSATGEFSRSIRANFQEADVPVGTPSAQPEFQVEDDQIDLGSLGLNLSHTFSRHWSANALTRYTVTDYDREDLSGFESATASGGVSYRMTARQSIGTGATFTRQVVSQGDIQTQAGSRSTSADQETSFASLYGSWSYRISPLWDIDLRAGPTLIDSDLADVSTESVPGCLVPLTRNRAGQLELIDVNLLAPLDGGDIFDLRGEAFALDPRLVAACLEGQPSIQELTFSNPGALETQNRSQTIFADFGIRRSGERTSFALNYSRSAGESFGGRTSTIADVLTSTFHWDFSSRTTVELRGSYSIRTQATQVSLPVLVMVPGPGDIAVTGLRPDGTGEIRVVEDDNAFDLRNWVVTARVNRRLTRRLSGFLLASYFSQQNDSDVRGSVFNDLDKFEVGVGIRFTFDPIRL